MKEGRQRVKRRRVERKLQFGDTLVRLTDANPASESDQLQLLMIFEHYTGTEWRKLLAALDHSVETT